jgi:hypothetical protein
MAVMERIDLSFLPHPPLGIKRPLKIRAWALRIEAAFSAPSPDGVILGFGSSTP